MNYEEFTTLFKKQVYTVPYEKLLVLAVAICKKLFPDYQEFYKTYHWGNPDTLIDAIIFCEQHGRSNVEDHAVKEMIVQIDAVTPDTGDFGDWLGSYALNAAAAVSETLSFLVDKNSTHIFDVGTYMTDTIFFKIQEKEGIANNQLDDHTMMIEARALLLELCI